MATHDNSLLANTFKYTVFRKKSGTLDFYQQHCAQCKLVVSLFKLLKERFWGEIWHGGVDRMVQR